MKFALSITTAAILLLAAPSARAQAPSTNVTLVDSNRMAAAFAKGMPVLENSDFKVHAARRDGPGVAEVHARDTDIFHFIEGSAIFVTGGTTVDPKTVGPGEIRGKELRGGESHRVTKGDVIVIPKGVPHWFKEVHPPVLYYVVKVTTQ